MQHKIIIHNLNEIDDAAVRFLAETGDARLIAFDAPMGAGKTTFITALCRALGVREDAVSSPTFAIVNEYRAASGDSIYHFDFYRLDKAEDALDIGFYEYTDSGCLCLMEWPENIEAILPEETLRVSIEVAGDESRIITWNG